METPNRNRDAAVDEILAELRDKGAPLPVASSMDRKLDAILNELRDSGKGAGQPAPPPATPAATPPAAPQAARPEPAATPEPAAEAEPEHEHEAEPERGSIMNEQGEIKLFGKSGPAFEEPTAPRPDLSATLTGTRRLPIWDEETQNIPIEHRAGKAAAMDHVGPSKFEHDEELASWFSGEEDTPAARRAKRRAEKERQKQEKRDRKEALKAEKAAQKARRDAERRGVPLVEENPEAPDENLQSIGEAIAAVRSGKTAEEQQPRPEPEKTQQFATAEDAPPHDFFAGIPVFPVDEPAEAPAAAPEEAPPEAPAAEAPKADVPEAAPAPQEAADTPKRIPTFVPPLPTPHAPLPPEMQERAAQVARSISENIAGDTPEDAPVQEDVEKTRSFTVDAEKADAEAPEDGGKTRLFEAVEESAEAEEPAGAPLDDTRVFGAVEEDAAPAGEAGSSTQEFDLQGVAESGRVPTAAFTQEFDSEAPNLGVNGEKHLFVNEMAEEEHFKRFFEDTVSVGPEESTEVRRARFRNKKSHTALLTGEFTKLTEQAEAEDEEEFEDYNQPQDAELVEHDLVQLGNNLLRRVIVTLVLGLGMLWLGLGFTGLLPLPELIQPANQPIAFCVVYLVLLVGVVVMNFTTIASGLIGLVGAPTVDTPAALASVTALLQGVMLTVQLVTGTLTSSVTLFGGMSALILAFNALGKKVRAGAILDNFRMASSGQEHKAAYVLDGRHENAFNITKGLEEGDPSILISRPTGLVKGFLRQSFSLRWSDGIGRILGWILLLAAVATGVISYVTSTDLMVTFSCMAATFCIGAPLSSTLVSGIPSRLLQRGAGKVGAVVPGWSSIEELGNVNVVMAGARDIFPPSSIYLKGIKTFEKERIDLSILYAASVLVAGCDTLRDLFLAVVQGKSDILYKVDNLMAEPGKGFTAWVENNRIVVGNREILQRYAIDPPPLEMEMKFAEGGNMPLYLAVSGKLCAAFVLSYTPDAEVQDTLDGLIKSGVSLLVTSDDMNVNSELIENAYQLPKGVVKVLGNRELSILESLQSYLPESEGVMTHIGSFTSFIGGMRAAAGCAAAERMSTIVQIASVALAALLCLLLVFSQGLANLSLSIAILYQLGWTLLVGLLPLSRRY